MPLRWARSVIDSMPATMRPPESGQTKSWSDGLDDGEVLIESHLMLDYLDSLVPAGQAMFPRAEPLRHKALKVAALATGMADKAVSLFYEQRLHSKMSDMWADRCRTQIATVLDVLEKDRAGQVSEFWFGDRIGHADIAVAAALRFLNDAHPGLVDMSGFPAIAQHAAKLEALPVFKLIAQEFVAPA